MEKRRFHRFLLDTEIEHQTTKEKNKKKSKTKDLSKGGICITTSNKPLITDQIYIIYFKLPHKSIQIKAEAKVVWSKEYENQEISLFDNGLEFISIDKSYLNIIGEYSIGSVLEK